MSKKKTAPRVDKKKPHKSSCPREHFHRPGVYCKACDSIPSGGK